MCEIEAANEHALRAEHHPLVLAGCAGVSPVPVAIRGNRETYEARETLKRAGLTWNPTVHAWAGSLPVQKVGELKGMGLPVVELVPDPQAWVDDPVAPVPTPKVRARPRASPRTRSPPGPTLDPFGPREFDERDVTANLPDDSREEQERTMRRYLRDLRNRVKAVRAKLSADPSIGETLASNPEKAEAFYHIHHVTRDQVEHGVPDMDVEGMEWDDVREQLREQPAVDWVTEEAERACAVLPGTEA
jgi:hypothetical protein